MNDSNERVFEWRGIGNGIENYYYFKRIKGLWYLVKVENFSNLESFTPLRPDLRVPVSA